MTYQGILLKGDEVNLNNRSYPSSLVKKINSEIKSKNTIFDGPTFPDCDRKPVGKIKKTYIKDNKLYAEVELLFKPSVEKVFCNISVIGRLEPTLGQGRIYDTVSADSYFCSSYLDTNSAFGDDCCLKVTEESDYSIE